MRGSKRYTIVLCILIVIVAVVGSIFRFTHWGQEETPTATSTMEQEPEDGGVATMKGPNGETCHQSGTFSVVEQKKDGEPGTDFFVVKNSGGKGDVPCALSEKESTFALKNIPAAYYLNMRGKFLVLDQGTAPFPRTLLVYDLDTRKQVFSDEYAEPLSWGGLQVSYWTPLSEEPTEENCPDIKKFKGMGLGVVLESQVKLDLQTFKKTSMGQVRCEPMQ